MNSTETIPIDARVIALNETRNYNFKKGDKQYIKAMLGVYLYDKNSHTHCCSLTPSYWLIHLYDVCVLNSKGDKLDDSEKDRLFEEYENCPQDQTGSYFDVGGIDSLEESLQGKHFRYHVYGSPKVSEDDVSRDDQMEALREHFCCNHVI